MPSAVEYTYPVLSKAGAREVTQNCRWRQLRRCSDSVLAELWMQACEIAGTVFKRTSDGLCYTIESTDTACYGPLAGVGTWYGSCELCSPVVCPTTGCCTCVITFTISGITNGSCGSCTGYNANYEIHNTAACVWSNFVEGFGPGLATITCSGGYWYLSVADESCTAGSSFSFRVAMTEGETCPPSTGWTFYRQLGEDEEGDPGHCTGTPVLSNLVVCNCPTDNDDCPYTFIATFSEAPDFFAVVELIGVGDGTWFGTCEACDPDVTFTEITCVGSEWVLTQCSSTGCDTGGCMTFRAPKTEDPCPPFSGWVKEANGCHDDATVTLEILA